ncbi:hypothetical protein H1S01_11330 [Heliobacterium chlorum]|uniref:Scaffolding protein n=1 Tax=Heliobacterium chlorum TaxID=2698 RepID=A0ABR7T2V4_HELCL|nr:hypothetical protein [Heliobacterium chlorum]MBC9785099.1 hypothetical protein [Heliobacterium chlorum]
MAEELTKEVQTPETGPEQQKPTGDFQKVTDKAETPSDIVIPKTRFDEVNNKYKDLQQKLDELLTEKADQDRTQKEQQGKFEELYKTTADDLTKHKTQVKEASKRVEQLESVITGLLDAKLKAIPEEYHDLIPKHLPPEARLDWLNQAEGKGLFRSLKREEPVGAATNPRLVQTIDMDTLTPAQLLRAAYGSK